MQRRSLLGLGLAGGAALALAGAGASLLHSPAWRDGQLLPAGRTVFSAVARGVLEGSLPAAEAPRTRAISEFLARLQATIGAMPAATQAEVGDLLALLAMPPGRVALAGLAAPWQEATVPAIQAALQSMRESRLMLRRQAYHALRDLTHAAYFADASTWALLRYPGPTALS
jgi:hypothetical protein